MYINIEVENSSCAMTNIISINSNKVAEVKLDRKTETTGREDALGHYEKEDRKVYDRLTLSVVLDNGREEVIARTKLDIMHPLELIDEKVKARHTEQVREARAIERFRQLLLTRLSSKDRHEYSENCIGMDAILKVSEQEEVANLQKMYSRIVLEEDALKSRLEKIGDSTEEVNNSNNSESTPPVASELQNKVNETTINSEISQLVEYLEKYNNKKELESVYEETKRKRWVVNHELNTLYERAWRQ